VFIPAVESSEQDLPENRFLHVTSIGKNWQLKSLLVRFCSTPCKVGKVNFNQAGVEKTNFAEKNMRLSKMPFIGLANRRLQPLGHLSVTACFESSHHYQFRLWGNTIRYHSSQ
jgi:hypothetical protein